MAKVIGFVVGIVEIAVGVVFHLPFLVGAGATTLFGSSLSALLAPGRPERQASEVALTIGETPRQAIFGAAAAAGSLVDRE